jgi:hypothetical protein
MRVTAWVSAVLMVGGTVMLLCGLPGWTAGFAGMGVGGTLSLVLAYVSDRHPPRGRRR